jgi:23S rRNA pseudouridine1911/1915/1917 synthase
LRSSSPNNQRVLPIAHPKQLTVSRDGFLLAYLFSVLEQKRTAIKNLLKFGAIAVNGTTVRQFDYRVVPGDELTIGSLKAAAAGGKLEAARIRVLYEDDALLVVDKPSGLLTVANENDKTDTLFYRLNEYLKTRDPHRTVRPQVVHRLDEETSGVVLFALSTAMKEQLQATWPTVEKTYWAVVEGRPKREQGTITSHLVESASYQVYSHAHPTDDSQPATTHYRVLQTRDGLSLLEVRLDTGRKHQIRVHLATQLGCPVVGDRRYGATTDTCRRLALHAGRIALTHPATKERLNWESALPRPLARLFPNRGGQFRGESEEGLRATFTYQLPSTY